MLVVLGLTPPRNRKEDKMDPYADDDLGFDETLTVCDRCGEEIPLAEANSVDEEGHEWQYATLCNDCYAEVVAP